MCRQLNVLSHTLTRYTQRVRIFVRYYGVISAIFITELLNLFVYYCLNQKNKLIKLKLILVLFYDNMQNNINIVTIELLSLVSDRNKSILDGSSLRQNLRQQIRVKVEIVKNLRVSVRPSVFLS
jgi:hypothetical protein